MGKVSLVKPLASWGQLGVLLSNTGSLMRLLSPHKTGGSRGEPTKRLDPLFSLHRLMSLETSKAA